MHRLSIKSKISFLGSLLIFTVAAVAVTAVAVTAVAVTAVVLSAALAGEAREQLVDQALQNDSRLRLLDTAAVLQIRIRAARAETDVFAAEQALCLNAREAVVGNLVVLCIYPHSHQGAEGLGIHADAVDFA